MGIHATIVLGTFAVVKTDEQNFRIHVTSDVHHIVGWYHCCDPINGNPRFANGKPRFLMPHRLVTGRTGNEGKMKIYECYYEEGRWLILGSDENTDGICFESRDEGNMITINVTEVDAARFGIEAGPLAIELSPTAGWEVGTPPEAQQPES